MKLSLEQGRDCLVQLGVPPSLVGPLVDCVTVKGRCFESKEFPKPLFPPLFGGQIVVNVGYPL